ncbi:LysR substrate-binding domain-containing protein [Burkholderia sp. AU45251]|uniref:LysR substrate-binding domain-containing protein n=1 Tax=Burkholderia sp. AU45251 TaxID=3059204 RepID=UPI0026557B58|nr:LysR substrate-binding domain-containing protein [Burkholderia sp. AU45251]MDN7514272.1 LysR substrate-binding domain-containing protein [Burkholderia sp. AU45251]
MLVHKRERDQVVHRAAEVFHAQRVKIDGQPVGNGIGSARDAALSGLGLAYLPHAYVAGQLAAGQRVEALSGWRKTYEPYYLYYPSRRHASPAFSLVVDALRYRG